MHTLIAADNEVGRIHLFFLSYCKFQLRSVITITVLNNERVLVGPVRLHCALDNNDVNQQAAVDVCSQQCVPYVIVEVFVFPLDLLSADTVLCR